MLILEFLNSLSTAVANTTLCVYSGRSSLQADRKGFYGIFVVVITSLFSSLLMLLAFLLMRKYYNFGRVALVYGAGSSSSGTYQMPNASNSGPNEDQGFWSWIRACSQLRYDDIYDRCGDNARIYLNFQRHLIYFLAVATAVSLCVLIPINLMGKDSSDRTVYFLKTTMANVQNQDNLLWLHIVLGVILSAGMVLCLRRFSLSIQDQDQEKVQKTVFIEGLPCNADEGTIQQHFSEAYPNCKVESVHLCRDVSKLIETRRKRRKARQNLAAYTQLPTTGQQGDAHPTRFTCCCVMPGPEDNAEAYKILTSKLQKEFEEELEGACQSHLGMAFVTFSERSEAILVLGDFNTIVCHRELPQSSVSNQLKISRWSVSEAYHPQDILWSNMSVRGWRWWSRCLLINVMLLALMLFLTTPDKIVSSLKEWKIMQPFYYMMRSFKFVPTLQLWIFSAALRSIVYYSSPYQAHWFKSSESKMMLYKMYLYLIFMVLIAPLLGSSNLYGFLESLFIGLQDVQNINSKQCLFSFNQGAVAVHYVIMAAFIANTMDLVRIPEFLWYITRMALAKTNTDRQHIMQNQAKYFSYGEMYARMLCVITVVMSYSNISPLVVPCGLLYMLIRHVVDMHNLYYVHLPRKQDRRVHEAAVKLSMAAPIIWLMRQFLFCAFRRGWILQTVFQGVLLATVLLACLIKVIYSLIKSLCKSNYKPDEPSPATTRGTGHVPYKSPVYVPSVIINIDMEEEQQNTAAETSQVDECNFYRNYP